MDDTAFLPTEDEFYRGGIWKHLDTEPEENKPTDPALTGDVEAVEKQMASDAAKGEESPSVPDSADQSESADSLDPLVPTRKLRQSLRSPGKETAVPKVASEGNLKGRVGRSGSFASVASAPAVVATDMVNVSGTSPARDNVDWAA